MHRHVSRIAVCAGLLCAAGLAGFGAMFPVFSQIEHPAGLLGATRVPRALAFNVTVFMAPGAMAAVVAWALRGQLSAARWSARIGAQLLLLSGVAFAAQGLLPLDSADLHGGGSRLHAAAWTAWWIAFAAGAVLLWHGCAGERRARLASGLLAAAGATLAFALLAPLLMPGGLAQRLAFAGWFFALWLAGRLSRSAA